MGSLKEVKKKFDKERFNKEMFTADLAHAIVVFHKVFSDNCKEIHMDHTECIIHFYLLFFFTFFVVPFTLVLFIYNMKKGKELKALIYFGMLLGYYITTW